MPVEAAGLPPWDDMARWKSRQTVRDRVMAAIDAAGWLTEKDNDVGVMTDEIIRICPDIPESSIRTALGELVNLGVLKADEGGDRRYRWWMRAEAKALVAKAEMRRASGR